MGFLLLLGLLHPFTPLGDGLHVPADLVLSGLLSYFFLRHLLLVLDLVGTDELARLFLAPFADLNLFAVLRLDLLHNGLHHLLVFLCLELGLANQLLSLLDLDLKHRPLLFADDLAVLLLVHLCSDHGLAVVLHLVFDRLLKLTFHPLKLLALFVLGGAFFVHVSDLEPALELFQLLALLADALDLPLLALLENSSTLQLCSQ
mmetsp:Transcript_32828/g.94936  ORF Transcript_32828/g.94936 Transcript_32828/m.94936 type:complete len:203 (-) Transcript_32828:327-935(-)